MGWGGMNFAKDTSQGHVAVNHATEFPKRGLCHPHFLLEAGVGEIEKKPCCTARCLWNRLAWLEVSAGRDQSVVKLDVIDFVVKLHSK
jgi:hypothetical protein